MDNRTRKVIVLLMVVGLIFCLAIFIIENGSDHFVDEYGLTIVTAMTGFASVLAILDMMKKKETDNDISKFNRLLEYSKKRKEIEQEISRLTNELTRSDVGEYVNLNRLVFAGQSGFIGGGAINYEQFLNQFGLDRSSVQIEKNYAIFLTPFNRSSDELYFRCLEILNGMGINLQRTNNIVDKNDIMMNIVSQIVRAEFLIVNIDERNPNVYYELGIAHAIGKPTILISNVDYPDNRIGFDIRQKQIILYKDDMELERELLYQVNRIRNRI